MNDKFEFKIFSFRLYKDALKQLRLPGIIIFLILMLIAILIPVGGAISYGQLPDYEVSQEIVSLLTVNPFLVLCFFILAPILVLSLFRFLNKRNGSDFYYSLPQTGICLFLSYFAAVMTWIIGIIVVVSGTTLMVLSFFPSYFIINWGASFSFMLNVFVAAFYVAAAVVLAMCVTGTGFTNIAVAGLLLFAPRLFMALLLSWVNLSLPIIDTSHWLLNPSFNIVFGTMYSAFFGSVSTSGILLGTASGIYTLVIGILFFGASVWVFHKRKSESAEHASPNRLLQGIYRISIAMIICLIPCRIIFEFITARLRIDASDLFAVMVLYIIALFAYFLYELLTTRKVRNLLKAAPGLLILAGLNIALIGGLSGISHVVLNQTIAVEDISYVRFVENATDEDNYYIGTGNSKDYFVSRVGEIRLSSDEIKGLVAEQLNDTLNTLKTGRYNTLSNQRLTQTVAIHTDGRTMYRRIFASTKNCQQLAAELKENEAYRKIYQELPNLDEIPATINLQNGPVLSNEELQELYECLRAEIKDIPFEEWYQAVTELDYSYYDVVDIMHLTFAEGSTEYTMELPVGHPLSETLKLYVSKVNAIEETRPEAILKNLDKIVNTESSVDLDIYFYPEVNSDEPFMSGNYIISELVNYDETQLTAKTNNLTDQIPELVQALEESGAREFNPEGPFIKVILWTEAYDEKADGYVYNTYYGFFPMNVQELPTVFAEQMAAY